MSRCAELASGEHLPRTKRSAKQRARSSDELGESGESRLSLPLSGLVHKGLLSTGQYEVQFEAIKPSHFAAIDVLLSPSRACKTVLPHPLPQDAETGNV